MPTGYRTAQGLGQRFTGKIQPWSSKTGVLNLFPSPDSLVASGTLPASGPTCHLSRFADSQGWSLALDPSNQPQTAPAATQLPRVHADCSASLPPASEADGHCPRAGVWHQVVAVIPPPRRRRQDESHGNRSLPSTSLSGGRSSEESVGWIFSSENRACAVIPPSPPRQVLVPECDPCEPAYLSGEELPGRIPLLDLARRQVRGVVFRLALPVPPPPRRAEATSSRLPREFPESTRNLTSS